MNQFRGLPHHCRVLLSHSCAYIHLRQSVNGKRNLVFGSWLSYNPPHSMYAYMLLLFYKQLVPSFKAPPPHPSRPPPVKGGIPWMFSPVPSPPRSPILPPSSNIHPFSLSLRDHYCQAYDWPEHSDGYMVLLFQRFLLYLCIIHHHTTTLLKESGPKHHAFFGKRCSWPDNWYEWGN